MTWALLVAMLFAAGATGQKRLSLQEASSRKSDTFAPVHEGEQLQVEGTAATKPIPVGDYSHLSIVDGSGYGLMLDAPSDALVGIEPGDYLQVTGVLINRAGVPGLQPAEIRKLGTRTPPAPLRVQLGDIESPSHIGMLVQLDGTVVTLSENSGGEVVLVGNGGHDSPLRVFLPRATHAPKNAFHRLEAGDKVRIVGISSQYCPQPPYNRSYELLVAAPSAVEVLGRSWMLSPQSLILWGVGLAAGLAIWWTRERALLAQRARLRAINALAEEVLGAETPGAIARRLPVILTPILKAADCKVYLLNKPGTALDRVPTPSDPEALSVNVNTPIGALSAAVALCFRNRSLLHIPDVRKSPIINADDDRMPRSVLLAPMFAQQDLLGIMALQYRNRTRRFSPDDIAAIQHLANQVGIALRLQEQASMREQLLRSEKMAAAGQLISGVATELQGPLSAIHTLAEELLDKRPGGVLEPGLREISFEAQRGAGVVNRLVSFARADEAEATPIDLAALVADLFEFRSREWETKGVQARNAVVRQPQVVLADRSQLEQVLLNLFVHAEQSMQTSPEKSITVGCHSSNKHVTVTIDYTDRSPDFGRDPFEDHRAGEALGLQVCQGMVHSHGGEIRLVRSLPTGCRFELELPLLQQPQTVTEEEATSGRPGRPLTVMMLEPDSNARRKLLNALSIRGHRAVPVESSEEAIDLAERLHFDVVFCSVRVPGMNWVELFDRIRREIGSFVLVTEGYDADLSRAFKGSDGYLLSKPIDDAEAQRLIATIESRQESLARG